MTTILHNRRYLLLLLIFASVLVSVVATLAIVAAQAPDTHHTLGARLGSAYIDGEENIVARVNGYPITQAEFAAERVRYRNLLWSINDLAERAVPDDEYAAGSSGDYFRGPLYRGPISQDTWITDKFNAELLLLETSGQDRVALAELILEYARFSKAVDAGHMPSKAEVAEFVDQTRAAHESHFATSAHSEWGDTAATQGVIEAVGAQRYWSEIYTARTTRNLADASWYQAVFHTAAEDYNRYSSINLHEAVDSGLDRMAIADVEVEIVDADEVKATPEEAIAYLHELWELQGPSPEPTAEPLAVQNLQASETHDSVTLTWDAETSPDVLGFEILRDSNTGVFQTIAELEPSVRRYVDTEGLRPNTGYYYAIRTIPNNAIEEAQIKIYTLPAP